jgi:sarcosine oxidase subunit gamma
VLRPGRHGAEGANAVTIALPPSDIVQLIARKGRSADLAAAVQAACGLALPGPGCAAGAGELTALWIQPDGWFVTAPRGAEGALARTLKAAAGDAGSVVDQSHGRTLVTLAGGGARWVLSKECRVDLHPSAFAPGQVASTQIAHLGCTIHQADDAPTYRLIVFTTFLRSFLEALTHAAGETGYFVA